jgi:uncharacterized protein YggT (Ycf19 family)
MQPTTNQPYSPQQPYPAQQPVAPPEPVNPQPIGGYAAPAPTRVEATAASGADRVALAVYVLFGILEGLLAIRILLKLLGANPDAGFSSFVYGLTAPFVAPFSGVFPTPVTHNSVFEFSSLLALVVYALVGWGVVRLIQVFGQRQTTTVTR